MLLEHGSDVKEDGSTLLRLASRRGHVELICMFLGRGGADVTVKGNGGSTQQKRESHAHASRTWCGTAESFDSIATNEVAYWLRRPV